MTNPYGICPKCGAPGVTRERRPNGNDVCARGHTYPSRDAVDQPKAPRNKPIEQLLAEYEAEGCNHSNTQGVIDAAFRYVDSMEDSQVRCLLYVLARDLARVTAEREDAVKELAWRREQDTEKQAEFFSMQARAEAAEADARVGHCDGGLDAMKIDPKAPAYPFTEFEQDGKLYAQSPGIPIRLAIAAQIMAQLVVEPESLGADGSAKWALKYADTLIEAYNEG